MTATLLDDGAPCAIPACPCGHGPMPSTDREHRFPALLTLLELSAVEALRCRIGVEKCRAHGDIPRTQDRTEARSLAERAHLLLWTSFVKSLRRYR